MWEYLKCFHYRNFLFLIIMHDNVRFANAPILHYRFLIQTFWRLNYACYYNQDCYYNLFKFCLLSNYL